MGKLATADNITPGHTGEETEIEGTFRRQKSGLPAKREPPPPFVNCYAAAAAFFALSFHCSVMFGVAVKTIPTPSISSVSTVTELRSLLA